MIYIVVPAYNEQDKIGEVIDDIRAHGYDNLIVIDDASKDNTRQIALQKGVTVLHHVINRDQGAALRTGVEYALQKGASIIVTFDSDGQHHAKDLDNIIGPVKNRLADVTLGSRFLEKKSNVPFIRKMFLKGGIIIQRYMYGVKLSDAHNGFRALSRYAATKIKIECDGKEHASEIVELIGKHNLQYIEVPVTITYSDYSKSKAHVQSSWNGFKILYKMLIKRFLQ